MNKINSSLITNHFRKFRIAATFGAVCALAGSGYIDAMQIDKPQSRLMAIKDGFKSFGQLFLKAYGSLHIAAVLGIQSDERFYGPDAHMAISTSMGIHKGINLSKYAYKRYITLPLQQKRENSDHKAPQEVQQKALLYAKTMCRPHHLRDWARLQYLKRFGFLTVYDGPAKDNLHYFENKEAAAYASTNGGIYFRSSITKNLSPEQRQYLAHEIGHHIGGDMTIFMPVADKAGSVTWFNKEYLAQKRSIETLFKLQDFEAIDTAYKAHDRAHSVSAYDLGVRDTFLALTGKKPQPSLEKRYKDSIEYSLCGEEFVLAGQQYISLSQEIILLIHQQNSLIAKNKETNTLSPEKQGLFDQYAQLEKEKTQKKEHQAQLDKKIQELKNKMQELF